MKSKKFRVIVLAVFLLAICSCSKPAVRYNPMSGQVDKGDVHYSTGVIGAEWKKIKGDYGDLAFYNPDLNSSISADSICPLRGDPPLRVLLNHLMFGFTDRKVLDEQTIKFDEREALRVVYTAKLDGIKRKFLVYIMKKNNCVYDLQYQSSEEHFDKGVGVFENFVKGFRTDK